MFASLNQLCKFSLQACKDELLHPRVAPWLAMGQSPPPCLCQSSLTQRENTHDITQHQRASPETLCAAEALPHGWHALAVAQWHPLAGPFAARASGCRSGTLLR